MTIILEKRNKLVHDITVLQTQRKSIMSLKDVKIYRYKRTTTPKFKFADRQIIN